MIKKLRVQNFRGLHDLAVENLRKVNLFAGQNNAGKTTLLEAIYLLLGRGNPKLALNVSAQRGITSVRYPPATMSDILWKPLFEGFSTTNQINISAEYDKSATIQLKIVLTDNRLADIQFNDIDQIPTAETAEPDKLEFTFTDENDKKFEGQISPTMDGTRVIRPDLETKPRTVFLASNNLDLRQDAFRFGRLRARKQGHLIVEALKAIEPRLLSLEELSASGDSMIWGDIGLDELLPLSAMGDGMARLVRLLLAVATASNGVVLVDEIENGLHHSVLPKVWEALGKAANVFNTQIFATTHSYECIAAAQSSLDKKNFYVHRLENIRGRIECITFFDNEIETALKHHMDVR